MPTVKNKKVYDTRRWHVKIYVIKCYVARTPSSPMSGFLPDKSIRRTDKEVFALFIPLVKVTGRLWPKSVPTVTRSFCSAQSPPTPIPVTFSHSLKNFQCFLLRHLYVSKSRVDQNTLFLWLSHIFPTINNLTLSILHTKVKNFK